MNKIILCLAILFYTNSILAQETCGIIPMPTSYRPGKGGDFILDKSACIVGDESSFPGMADYFRGEILKLTGLDIPVRSGSTASSVQFILDSGKSDTESYSLVITSSQILVSASSREGIFHGIISLLQLVKQSDKKLWGIRPCEILDNPRYRWRGLMLDESRHFFGKEKVKALLDWMAFYKLNRFHWHLTDEPGWRIEIKQYPRLTSVGGIGEFKNGLKPAQYYSQNDIREIVDYAQKRCIEVIPEIDMPGHAAAANRAYPEFSGGGTPPEYPDFTFNPAKEETYQFLTNILTEVDALFPSQMIHLGGDEVQYGNASWQTNIAVKNLQTQKNLKDLKAVEYYFIRRMADSISAMNNRVLAWDEIVEASLPANQPIIFWWRQDKPGQLQKAMDNGYETVLCPRLPLYFDFVQDSTHTVGRRWRGAHSPLSNLYSFSHTLFPETNSKAHLILGIQANIWTETIVTSSRLDYMIFPRIAALAEAGWTIEGKKDFSTFETRLKEHLKLYARANLYYYNPFDPKEHPEVVK